MEEGGAVVGEEGEGRGPHWDNERGCECQVQGKKPSFIRPDIDGWHEGRVKCLQSPLHSGAPSL